MQVKVRINIGFPGRTVGKNPFANAGPSRDVGTRHGFDPWVRKIPWSRKWQPAPVSLPGKFHGQRSVAGSSPWGCTELDTTEQLTHTHGYQREGAHAISRSEVQG